MKKLIVRLFLYPIVCVVVTLALITGLIYITPGSVGTRAEVSVWVDTNQNGVRDGNEKGLQNVCVNSGLLSSGSQYVSEYYNCSHSTDEDGIAIIYFHTGPCWNIYNLVILPEGYSATTSNVSIGCTASVGLAKGDPKDHEENYKDFVKREANKLWITFFSIVVTIGILLSEGILLLIRVFHHST